MDSNQQPQPSAPAPSQPTPSVSRAPGAPEAGKGLAIATLVVGIVAFLFGWVAVFGIILGLVAIVLGIVALIKKQNKAMSVIGLILGALALITSLIITVFAAALFNNADFQKAVNDASKQQSSNSEMTSGEWTTTEANAAYEKITNGMTKEEVKTAVGRDADNCTETDTEFGVLETCSYGNIITDDVTFSVQYTDGKVTSKSKHS